MSTQPSIVNALRCDAAEPAVSSMMSRIGTMMSNYELRMGRLRLLEIEARKSLRQMQADASAALARNQSELGPKLSSADIPKWKKLSVEHKERAMRDAIDEIKAGKSTYAAITRRYGLHRATIRAYAAAHGIDVPQLGRGNHGRKTTGTIIDMVRAGSSDDEISVALRVSHNWVVRVRRDCMGQRYAIKSDAIISLHRAGVSAQSISERLGCTRHYVLAVTRPLRREAGQTAAK